MDEIKLLRDEIGENTKRLTTLERQLNNALVALQQLQLYQPPNYEINITNNDALADLQRQLDNFTNVFFAAHQRRIELLLTDTKSEVKTLEEKTSNWLLNLNAQYTNSLRSLTEETERLADSQAGFSD